MFFPRCSSHGTSLTRNARSFAFLVAHCARSSKCDYYCEKNTPCGPLQRSPGTTSLTLRGPSGYWVRAQFTLDHYPLTYIREEAIDRGATIVDFPIPDNSRIFEERAQRVLEYELEFVPFELELEFVPFELELGA